MIPILYEANETDFTTLGIGPLGDAIDCVVTEELNGEYELEMTYPVSGIHYSELVEDRLIYAVPFEGGNKQIFKIYQIEKPLNGKVVVRAEHIHYLLYKMVVMPFNASTAMEAMTKIRANIVDSCPFNFTTDKETVAAFKMVVPIECGKLLGGVEDSILDTYGPGDYEFDNFNVILHANRGTDSGVTVRYGKNMTELEASVDTTNVYTGIIPYYRDSEDNVTYATGYAVWSEHKSDYAYPLAKVVDMSSWFDSEREAWERTHPDEVYAPSSDDLISKANTYLTKNTGWNKNNNIKVSFVNLWQSDEYSDLAVLERVKMSDTVTVVYQKLGVKITKKVIKTVYNVLLDRYNSIELGTPQTSMTSEVANTSIAIQQASTESRSMLDKAIDHATKLITGGLGGNVVINTNANGNPNEILIMDTPNKETAVNVWRFNLNGLGHSHSGYNGPFDDVALTQDGKINANMITVGTLSANRVRAGLLTDEQGYNYWNLTTGEFRLSSGVYFGDKTFQNYVKDLQDQIDGNVTTWFYAYAPTTSNEPASTWTTVNDKIAHIGDLFYNSNTGYCYRWQVKTTAVDPAHPTINDFEWVQISDEDIAAAMAAANAAQDTADHKRRIFTTQPTTPYDVGDTWMVGANGDILTCMNARQSGDFVSSDWSKQNKYTDDSSLNAFVNGTYADFVSSTGSALAGMITTYYQATAPTTHVVGDLWIETDNDNQLHRWNGTSWESVRDDGIQEALTAAANAQTTADGKIVTFAQASQPTATDVGDLWVDTDDSNKMYRWNGTSWVVITDSSALNAFVNGSYATFVTNTTNALDGKITTYYQATAPTNHVTGDLWIDTDDGNKLYRWNGSSWVSVQDSGIQSALTAASNAQTTADGKIVTFAQTTQPTATDIGDLWVDTDDNNKLYRWNGSSWVVITDSSALNAFVNGTFANFVTSTDNKLGTMITTYYQATAPTNHVTGDLWIDTDDDNKLYRWNGSSWVSVRDAGIQSALTAASNAQTTADGKIVTFAQNTAPIATDVGDLWIDTAHRNKLYRWNGTLWEAYTDTSALNDWVTGTYSTDKANLEAQIDKKAETWYQSTDPATAWTTDKLKEAHVGDLWYNTANNANTTWFYQKNGSSYRWVQQDVPKEVFDEIDGKAQIFISQPTIPYYAGDLWFNSSSSDIMTCIRTRETGSYTASDWEKRNKYIDTSAATSAANTAVSNYDTTLNQQKVFNKLTNNGQASGIFMEQGELYINADYLVAGMITDKQNNSYWDLDEGILHLGSNTTIGNNQTIATSFDVDYVAGLVSSEVTRATNAEKMIFANYQGPYKPETDNLPASNWSTYSEAKAHENETFYDTVTNRYYKWVVTEG